MKVSHKTPIEAEQGRAAQGGAAVAGWKVRLLAIAVALAAVAAWAMW